MKLLMIIIPHFQLHISLIHTYFVTECESICPIIADKESRAEADRAKYDMIVL